MAPVAASLGLLLAEWRVTQETAASSCLVLATGALRAAQGGSVSGGAEPYVAVAYSRYFLFSQPTNVLKKRLK
jgi:hypothetical protein